MFFFRQSNSGKTVETEEFAAKGKIG